MARTQRNADDAVSRQQDKIERYQAKLPNVVNPDYRAEVVQDIASARREINRINSERG